MNELAYLVLTNMEVAIISSLVVSLITTLVVDSKTENYYHESALRHVLNVAFVTVFSSSLATMLFFGLSVWIL
jgi:uncharacterized membrane protein